MKKTRIIALVLALMMVMTGVLTACRAPLDTAIDNAKKELKSHYDGLLAANDYTSTNKASLLDIYNTAVADVGSAESEAEITDVVATAKIAMSGVSCTAKQFTYNGSVSVKPATWNPHNWTTNGDSTMMAYLELGFVDSVYKSEGVYEWVYEMATSITDVTASASAADRTKWGIKAGQTGRMWKIVLNPNAKWDNGDVINADSYIYSMSQLLNPEMKNSRSDLYRKGESSLKGANGYYNPGLKGWLSGSDVDDGTDLYIIWNDTHEWLEDTMLDFCEWAIGRYGDSYAVIAALQEILDAYDNATGEDKIKLLMDESQQDLIDILDAALDLFGGTWKDGVFGYVEYPDVPDMENVGLYKGANDYELYYVTNTVISEYYFFISCGSLWLVHEATYEAGKQPVGELVVTNYNTSLSNTRSYGVYKLNSFEVNNFTLVRNEEWYGWDDGNHEGQFQATKLRFIVESSQTILLEQFIKGEIDEVDLTAADMSTYKASDYLLKTPESYTMRFFFNADPVALKALDVARGDSSKSVQILQYTEFRKALSLAFNREEWCTEVTAGHIPSCNLINSMYFYDIENNPDSVYRNSVQAKTAICKAYGTYELIGTRYADLDEAYNATIGYDLALAKQYFTTAYNKAIADGTYVVGQKIEIHVGAAAGSVTTTLASMEAKFNEFIAAATTGTPLAGKVTVKYIYNLSDRYLDVFSGARECGYGAIGGAVFYVYRHFNSYLSSANAVGGHINEGGFSPETEQLTLTLDFGKGVESKTKTYENWVLSLNEGGEYYTADHEVKLNILAALEQEILELCYTFPIAVSSVVSMYAQKINYVTTNYNVMYTYGGLRFMTFNYSDIEWAAYVTSQGGTLNYA